MYRFATCATALLMCTVQASVGQTPATSQAVSTESQPSRYWTPSNRVIPDPEWENAIARCGRIDAELRTLGEHDWAGTYVVGFDVIVLAPQSGLFAGGTPSMQFYALYNHGDVTGVNDRTIILKLVVDPAYIPNPPKLDMLMPMSHISSEMATIAWGNQRYLVPIERVPDFCCVVNAGFLPTSSFYTRITGEDEHGSWSELHKMKRQPGLPIVPDRFKPYLLPSPVTGEVVSASAIETVYWKDFAGREREFREMRLTLSVGQEQGILKGMCFFPMEDPKRILYQVVNVARETCVADYRWTARNDRAAPPPTVGDRLTTRLIEPVISKKEVSQELWLSIELAERTYGTPMVPNPVTQPTDNHSATDSPPPPK
ncbi:MAG: hypothetical protein ABIG44_00110 [Planctomycetota bacterium]